LIATSLTGLDQYLLHAFLCTCLARNYFAHHHYLDDDLMRTKESAFMIGGILVTMLVLIVPRNEGAATQGK
jgi:hypothetical protein